MNEYYLKNREKAIAYGCAYAKNNKDKVNLLGKKKGLKRKLASVNWTLDAFNAQSKLQRNRCAICKQFNFKNKQKYRLAIDHCHKTNKVRGLLCSSCNLGISQFRDNPKWLSEAAKYIKRTLL